MGMMNETAKSLGIRILFWLAIYLLNDEISDEARQELKQIVTSYRVHQP